MLVICLGLYKTFTFILGSTLKLESSTMCLGWQSLPVCLFLIIWVWAHCRAARC